MKNKIIETISADIFKVGNNQYEFPFTAVDETPGGRSLGRIEWVIEPIKGKKYKGRYYIEKLLVSAKQTYDKRYSGKLFEIPCFTESITTDTMFRRDSYFHFVWRMSWCEIHNTPVFDAYPKNEHTKLIINTNSSISIYIDFK